LPATGPAAARTAAARRRPCGPRQHQRLPAGRGIAWRYCGTKWRCSTHPCRRLQQARGAQQVNTRQQQDKQEMIRLTQQAVQPSQTMPEGTCCAHRQNSQAQTQPSHAPHLQAK
jgi:hypothetical protein